MNGKITNFQFLPMHDAVPSILHIWVRTEENRDIMFEARDSIKNLSNRFGFIIESDDCWDFTGFIGRECKVTRGDKGYVLHPLKF